MTAAGDWLSFVPVGDPAECWHWTGTITDHGYGRLGRRYGHRLSYEHFIGPIPEGLQIDHLCRVRDCVNPWHLEPVTIAENVRRGISGAMNKARMAARTHCKHGHPLSGDNIRIRSTDKARICLTCQREHDRVWQRNNRKSRSRALAS